MKTRISATKVARKSAESVSTRELVEILKSGPHPDEGYLKILENLARKQAPIEMKTRITATEAARKFSEILNRVTYKGETFVVERGGRPVCEIAPARTKKFTASDFAEMIKSAPRPDDEYFDAVEEIIKNRQPVAPSPWRR